MRRAPRRRRERELSRFANVYRDVRKREIAPFKGTFAEWRALEPTKQLALIYHPHLVKAMNRRFVLFDLLRRPTETA